jgi:hypothetical protein
MWASSALMSTPSRNRAARDLLAELRSKHDHRGPLAVFHQLFGFRFTANHLDANTGRIGQVAFDDFGPVHVLFAFLRCRVLIARVQVDDRNPQPIVGLLPKPFAQ